MKTVLVRMKVSDVLRATSNEGGYVGGDCLACGESGWFGESGHGYPSSTPEFPKGPAGLRHKRGCVYGALLGKDGKFR